MGHVFFVSRFPIKLSKIFNTLKLDFWSCNLTYPNLLQANKWRVRIFHVSQHLVLKFSSLCSLLLLKLKHLSGLLLLKVHMLTQVSEGGFNGLNWENTRSLLHFLIFLLENIKNAFVLSDVFWIPPDVFSTHSTPVASGRYVFRYGLLRPPRGHP